MKKVAPLFVLLAGILWGIIGVFVRRLNATGFLAMDIVAIRAVTTSVMLFLFLLLFDRGKLVVKGKDIWCFVGTGIFSIVFFNFCYFQAITETSLSIAAILLYTAPAFVMVISAFLFQEKITKQKVWSLVLTFLGCVLVTGVVGSGQRVTFRGVLFGLGAGIGYALYSIFSRFALKRGYHSLTISFYTFVFAMLGALPLSKLWKPEMVSMFGIKTVLFCLLFGLISTVLPYFVYTRGLAEMENSRASILASIEPVTATLLGVLFYREHMSLLQVMGVLLVIVAIALGEIKGTKNV